MTAQQNYSRREGIKAQAAARRAKKEGPVAKELMAAAWAALVKMVADDGLDDQPAHELWDVVPWCGKLLALPRDPAMADDCHMEWSAEGWLLVEGAAPVRCHDEQWCLWWERVCRTAARYGVDVRDKVPPEGALLAWEKGRSGLWYALNQLEDQLGLPHKVRQWSDIKWDD